MAAITPTTTLTENFGSTTMYIATFSGINTTTPETGDTWTSNIPSVVGHWFHATDDPTTQTSGRVDVSLSAVSSGQFRFRAGETDKAGQLYVLSLT